MKFTDLVVGEKYILERPQHQVATYEGKHEGVLTTEDGTLYYGGDGALRFSFERKDGSGTQIVLIDDGRGVKEPEATKIAREKDAAETKVRQAKARAEAVEYLTSLGLRVLDRYSEDRVSYYTLTNEEQATAVTISTFVDAADDTGIDNITIAKLKRILAR